MRHKVWVGLGAAGLVGAGAVGALAVPAAAPLPTSVCGSPFVLAAGEGGEGAVKPGLPPRLAFMRELALVRGHLHVANELVDAGRWHQARPHAGHPAKENYAGLAPSLATYGIAPFLAALRAYEAAVKAEDKARYAAAWGDLDARLAEAERKVAAGAEARPRFLVETALEVLNAAAGEYEQAVEKGRFAKVVEYQDGRGFTAHAQRLMEAGLSEGGADAATMAGVREAFAELKKAWPTPVAPARPVMDAGAVLANVSRVELKAGAAM